MGDMNLFLLKKDTTRQQRWNNLLHCLTKKYGDKDFEAPQIFGDHRDQMSIPPPMEEPEESFSASEICNPDVVSKVYNNWMTKTIAFRQRYPRKARKVLKSTENIKQQSENDTENETEKGESCCKDPSEIEFICTVEVPKPPKYYVHPVSKKKRLRNFIEM